MRSVPTAAPLAALALVFAAGCPDGDSPREKVLSTDDDPSGSSIEMVGVDPAAFECESVIPKADVAEVVGGEVAFERSEFDPPKGVPRACNYRLVDQPAAPGDASVPIRGWSVDFDCRERALDDAEDLMVQYATGRDAGAVRVGRSGLDHAGGGLLFIDDDAPCYVRIVGPGREQRAEIARLVARRLTPKTAPMTPVYRRSEPASTDNSAE